MQKIGVSILLFWPVTFSLPYTKLYMYGTNNNLLVQSRQLQNFVEIPKDKVN